MKICPQCHVQGKLISHSFVKVINVETGQFDETARQILDHILECPEHGQYEGNFKLTDYPEMERVKSPFTENGDTWKDPEPEPVTESEIQY